MTEMGNFKSILIVLLVIPTIICSCSSELHNGEDEFEKGNYYNAKQVLSNIKVSHKNYDKAQIILRKIELIEDDRKTEVNSLKDEMLKTIEQKRILSKHNILDSLLLEKQILQFESNLDKLPDNPILLHWDGDGVRSIRTILYTDRKEYKDYYLIADSIWAVERQMLRENK